ncbi:MAG: kynureninase, partial [Gammaproteobacteria bacterium]|nr:kynureninase [Gammaproteobacteria bacterium]
MTHSAFDASAEAAAERDANDPLAEFRHAFAVPQTDGRPSRYLSGHSLGLMPRNAAERVGRELERWAERGVGGHFDSGGGWYAYHERFAAPLAALLNADPAEVVAMNSLTVNLHLMLVSFFEPDGARQRILIEAGAFPSDRFAVESQLRFHGLDPAIDLIELDNDGSRTIDAELLDAALAAQGERVALILLPGVQYLTGQALDLAALTKIARKHGCRIGFDLAHAIGNVPIDLRQSEPDFAVWCSYKYLNGGPGAIGGAFVNRRWLADRGRPRFEGWWGQRADQRFDASRPFDPPVTADAWQLSNPPILAMAPLEVSLELFERAGIGQLRQKSIALTAYLEALLEHECGDAVAVTTPREPDARGAQLSLRLDRSADQ